jgi:hypothetical protein
MAAKQVPVVRDIVSGVALRPPNRRSINNKLSAEQIRLLRPILQQFLLLLPTFDLF